MAKKEKIASVKEKDSASSEILKKFKQSPGVYIGSVVILVLVVVTFVGGDFLSGGRRYVRKSDDLIFGYYDKVPISWVPGNTLSQYYERTFNNFRAQGYDPNDRWVNYYVWKQAYEGAVTHTAILQMLKKSGYEVSEKAVNKKVLQLPQFQDNGRFSIVLYNKMTDSARLALWRQQQEEIAMNMFFDDFFGLLVPSSEAKFIANMSSPQRSFDFTLFNVDDYPDSEYLSYARDNSKLFNSIQLSKITISSSEREAKKILATIKDGTTTFEDAARAQSKDSYADRGGDMGIRYCYEIDGEIPNADDRETVYSLGKGELSDVITVNNGWVFFRAENELTQADFDDSAVMDKVREYVKSRERGRMENWAIDKANEFITESKESGYANAARWRNLSVNSFGPIPINYGGVDLFTALESLTITGLNEQDLEGLTKNENFWKITFSTPLNNPTEPLVQGNKVYVFFPTEEIEAEETSKEDIASNYSTQFLQYIANQSLQKYFISNGKMTSHFDETYFSVFRSNE
ncbi:peptidyl-prolyl cis-trans isomerase [Treponema sp. R8-4-B8]